MINSKWLELYLYIHSHIDDLPTEKLMEEQLNDKLMFLSAQFLDKKKQDKNQIDWLEHEAFTLVLSDVLQKTSFTSSTLSFLFETLMAAQLCQLAMSMINHHKKVLPEENFKTKCGLVYQQLGDYDLAKAIFEEVLTLNNTNPMTHCHLGFTHLYLGNMEQAVDCFEESIEIAPDFVGGYQNLSGLYYQEGNFLQAVTYAEQAHLLDKKLISTYITAISSYLALGEKTKAEQWITAAFDNEVVSMELVRLAGISAHQNGRCEEAIEALDHYLSVNPSCFDVLNIRAHAKADIKDYTKLEPDLKQLLVFEPHDEWSLEQLFLCYFHTEQWSNAQIIMVELNKLSAHFTVGECMNSKNVTLLNILGLLGITFVLLMGSVLQVAWNELPCPLCLLQRVGFVMVMFGFMLNIIYGTQQRHYGVILVGALFGAATALRQVSLHVIPGTPGFGSPILGMHYYTWAFVIFMMTIVGVAVLLMLWNNEWSSEVYQMERFGRFACILAIIAVLVNVLSTFIECGPYQCPDNPVSYWLLDMFSH